jgi:hypothetical protein
MHVQITRSNTKAEQECRYFDPWHWLAFIHVRVTETDARFFPVPCLTQTSLTFQGTVCYLNGWILLVRHEANLSLSRDAHFQVTINMDIKTQQQKEADWPDSMLQTRRQHTCHGVPKLHEEEETWHGFPRQR